MNKLTLKHWTVIALTSLFIMWNPLTRSIVIFLLPLGSGIDDLIFIGLAVVVTTLGLVNYIKERRK